RTAGRRSLRRIRLCRSTSARRRCVRRRYRHLAGNHLTRPKVLHFSDHLLSRVPPTLERRPGPAPGFFKARLASRGGRSMSDPVRPRRHHARTAPPPPRSRTSKNGGCEGATPAILGGSAAGGVTGSAAGGVTGEAPGGLAGGLAGGVTGEAPGGPPGEAAGGAAGGRGGVRYARGMAVIGAHVQAGDAIAQAQARGANAAQIFLGDPKG